MRPIGQTLFGRLLCTLGVHQLVWAHFVRPDGSFSISGGCVRCNKSVGWDG